MPTARRDLFTVDLCILYYFSAGSLFCGGSVNDKRKAASFEHVVLFGLCSLEGHRTHTHIPVEAHNLILNNIILKPYFHVCSFCFSPQLAYLAWVTSVKTALKERQRHQRHLKSIERKEKEKEKQGRVDLQQEVFSAAG